MRVVEGELYLSCQQEDETAGKNLWFKESCCKSKLSITASNHEKLSKMFIMPVCFIFSVL